MSQALKVTTSVFVLEVNIVPPISTLVYELERSMPIKNIDHLTITLWGQDIVGRGPNSLAELAV